MTPMPPAADESIYKELLDHAIDFVTVINEQGIVIYQSAGVTDQFGYTPEEMLDHSIFDYLHPDDSPLAIDSISGLVDGAKTGRIVVRFKTVSGEWRKLEVLGKLHEHLGKRRIIINARDVTSQEEATDRLRRSQQLLQAAFNATGTICTISVLDTGKFIDVNDAWVITTGWQREEALGRTALELNIWGSEDNRVRITQTLRTEGQLRQFPATIQTKTGGYRSLLVDAEIVTLNEEDRLFISCVDITEREQIEEQLRQSQRMEAVGQLTGGIAHDLNNMLTVILGQIDLSTDKSMTIEAYEKAMVAIRRATERSSELIHQLMIFSRRQTLKPEIIRIAHSINKMRTLLEGSLGGEITITINSSDASLKSYIDEGLLENAILNLAVNARDAMRGGGKLTITIEPIDIDHVSASRYEVDPGQFIKIQVIDNGVGMSAEIAASAFEPFFTTKPAGQGTGLGLSMVFGFVKQTGGCIDIKSMPGEGTTVTLLLPRTDEEVSSPESSHDTTNRLADRTVLLIEDSDELRLVIRQLLESFGCKVIEYSGAKLNFTGSPIELILSDVILPGQLQGPDLVAEVTKQFPDSSVLYMSGYPRDRLTGKKLIDEQVPLLRKPFSRDELQQMLNQTLGNA